MSFLHFVLQIEDLDHWTQFLKLELRIHSGEFQFENKFYERAPIPTFTIITVSPRTLCMMGTRSSRFQATLITRTSNLRGNNYCPGSERICFITCWKQAQHTPSKHPLGTLPLDVIKKIVFFLPCFYDGLYTCWSQNRTFSLEVIRRKIISGEMVNNTWISSNTILWTTSKAAHSEENIVVSFNSFGLKGSTNKPGASCVIIGTREGTMEKIMCQSCKWFGRVSEIVTVHNSWPTGCYNPNFDFHWIYRCYCINFKTRLLWLIATFNHFLDLLVCNFT